MTDILYFGKTEYYVCKKFNIETFLLSTKKKKKDSQKRFSQKVLNLILGTSGFEFGKNNPKKWDLPCEEHVPSIW